LFTGIIEELGKVRSVEQRGENARIVIEAIRRPRRDEARRLDRS
jgi:riboflavin synthase alpha subunit